MKPSVRWGKLPELALGLLLIACGPSSHGAAATRSLELDIAPSRAQSLDRALTARLRGSPHAYFRFINAAFANRVCERSVELSGRSPDVNLHGDAHVEQYAVTDGGRGLVDFDDATAGPAVLDLARFGASLVLACRERGWQGAERRVIGEFLRGYRTVLEKPERLAWEPRVVARFRKRFPEQRSEYFLRLDAIMDPIDSTERAALLAALEPYIARQLARDPTLSPAHFAVQQVGRLRLGIGSAGLNKFLVRVRGPSDARSDDDVLEVKQLGDLSAISCLRKDASLGVDRILTAQARIAYEPYRLVGSIRFHGLWYWIHAWAKSYRELRISDPVDAQELGEIAFDVGTQLGLGHPKLAAPDDRALRRELLAFIVGDEAELGELFGSMADETLDAWQRFRAR